MSGAVQRDVLPHRVMPQPRPGGERCQSAAEPRDGPSRQERVILVLGALGAWGASGGLMYRYHGGHDTGWVVCGLVFLAVAWTLGAVQPIGHGVPSGSSARVGSHVRAGNDALRVAKHDERAGPIADE